MLNVDIAKRRKQNGHRTRSTLHPRTEFSGETEATVERKKRD